MTHPMCIYSTNEVKCKCINSLLYSSQFCMYTKYLCFVQIAPFFLVFFRSRISPTTSLILISFSFPNAIKHLDDEVY